MELREALTQISEIRRQVARSQLFRGYRALPVAFSGLLALLAAAFQQLWLPDPAHNVAGYLVLWIGTALISVLATGMEMALYYRRCGSSLAWQTTWLAVSQFLPCLAAGGLLTFVVAAHAHENLWMLPGLWAMMFSLGVFASHRLLPKATFWVGLFYMAAGTLCLTLREAALSPWAMGLPFGAGQLLTAGILYWTLERTDGELQEQAD
jgi:hypothetical protein